MTGAELAARITAARAALGDFRCEGLGALAAGPGPDWASWAHRLGAGLGALLDELGAPGDGPAAPVNPLDVPGRLEDHTGVLGLALARRTWPGDGEARQAATADALDAVDAMLGELYKLRAHLATGEAR